MANRAPASVHVAHIQRYHPKSMIHATNDIDGDRKLCLFFHQSAEVRQMQVCALFQSTLRMLGIPTSSNGLLFVTSDKLDTMQGIRRVDSVSCGDDEGFYDR